jgi:predicted metal-dependent hydrolase
VTTSRHQIEVYGISVEVVRKDIKNLHLGVYPPEGRVRIAVPFRFDDEAVRLAVISRLTWIRRQQAGFDSQERLSQREMVTGESHYVDGHALGDV